VQVERFALAWLERRERANALVVLDARQRALLGAAIVGVRGSASSSASSLALP
jgi:hypothetical protein